MTEGVVRLPIHDEGLGLRRRQRVSQGNRLAAAMGDSAKADCHIKAARCSGASWKLHCPRWTMEHHGGAGSDLVMRDDGDGSCKCSLSLFLLSFPLSSGFSSGVDGGILPGSGQ